jgi:dihydroorotase-like cyclic amidohydrolase
MLRALLDAAHRGVIALTDVPEFVSEAPARLFGIYPAKGTVAVGSDADVVIYDPRPPSVIDHSSLHTRAAPSAVMFDGLSMRGRVETTIVGGRIVFSNGELIERGGKFVRGDADLTRAR